ncbi:transposase family protein [Streptomyces sp. NBC_00868]|nr:transposase family protein [Streptomyces sp. NBC_00868]
MADPATGEDRGDRPGRTAPRSAPGRHGRRQQRVRVHRPPLARRADRTARRPGAAPGPRLEDGRPAGRGGGPDRRHPHPHPTSHRKADRRNYSGKHHSHGLHFLALTDERGRLIWISAARPGRTHDNTAARHDHILAHLRAAGLGALADLGFRGLDNDIRDPVIVTGYAASRTHKLTPGQKDANRVLAVGRAPVEHGFAHLKNWRILAKLRSDPARATRLLRALLVLTNLEVNR